jgi:hypothetical protein
MPTGRLFIIVMLAFGLVAGLVLANQPAWRDGPVPSVVWAILFGLALDLVIQWRAAQGRAVPLTMNERAIGIIGAGLIITVIVALV